MNTSDSLQVGSGISQKESSFSDALGAKAVYAEDF